MLGRVRVDVRPRLLGALLALGLFVAGCGTATTEDAGGGAGQDTSAEVADDAGADEDVAADDATADDAVADDAQGAAAEDASGSLIAAAVDRSASMTNARTRFTSVVSSPHGDAEISGEGVNSADSAAITMTMSGQMAAAFGADQLDMEVRILDGMMYQRFPQLIQQMGSDAEWLSFDLAALGPEFEQMLQSAQQADPAESLQALREIADVTEVGRETVNGIETTHYTGHLDMRAALEASSMDPAMLEESGIDLDQPVPVGVWIDDDGLVRRYETSMQMQDMTTTMSFEVLEYGIDVDVTAPPAGDTVSFEQLMQQHQGG